jgi:hypothetical protein
MAAPEDRKNKLDALLGRALRDKAFREKLMANPVEVGREVGLSVDELDMVVGGISLGSMFDPGQRMWCTEKTCNEKGGARVVIYSPDDDFNPIIQGGPVTKGG